MTVGIEARNDHDQSSLEEPPRWASSLEILRPQRSSCPCSHSVVWKYGAFPAFFPILMIVGQARVRDRRTAGPRPSRHTSLLGSI